MMNLVLPYLAWDILLTKMLLAGVIPTKAEAFDGKYDVNSGMGGMMTQGEFRFRQLTDLKSKASLA